MIYALLDRDTLLKRGISLRYISEKIEKLNVPIAQYRDKFGSLEEKIENLKTIKRYFSGKLIINDTIELIDYVDGVHLGQEDIREFSRDLKEAVYLIRKKIDRKILGLSTHNRAEILKANSLDLDYIGLGAYRATSTKRDAEVIGKDIFKLIKLSKHPIAIIGGVKISDTFPREVKYKVIGSDLYEKDNIWRKQL